MNSSRNSAQDKKIVIAIDGFSSGGKSTFARMLAARLGYIFIDTGAMYRAVTLYGIEHGAIRNGVPDRERLVGMLGEIAISFRFNPRRQASDIYVNGECVEEKIRGIEVSAAVSSVSSIPEVRRKLVALQQRMGKDKGVVMDGRDIGTVVLPDAGLKIFLSASAECRAQRRWRQLQEKGIQEPYADVLRELEQRDYDDTHRAIAPLKAAPDAVHIDTSDLTLEQSIDAVCAAIRTRFGLEADA